MAEKRSTVLRRLINREEILFRPGVAIALHAQIAQALGFEAVGASGSHFASHVLGLPDAGLVTMTEIVENIRRICSAVTIPVIADCDTGFGNAINVRRTTAEIIRAGAAGLFIEDQAAPKRCGFVKGKELIPLEEAVGKYRAAVDARDELDEDFIVMARTDARTAVGGSVEEVIRRARAYREAGADVIYVEALQSREEIRTVRAAIEGPFTVSCTAIEPHPTLQEMQDMGMCMTLSSFFFKAGTVAAWDLLAAMKERGLDPYIELLERTKDHPIGGWRTFDLTGFRQVAEWERKYLSPELLERREASIGLYDPTTGEPEPVVAGR
jgi:2,3-dimethylmalate lyase